MCVCVCVYLCVIVFMMVCGSSWCVNGGVVYQDGVFVETVVHGDVLIMVTGDRVIVRYPSAYTYVTGVLDYDDNAM